MGGQLPFEGDTFILGEIIKLRDRLGLTSCVETGTQYGATTKALAEVFKHVMTIEADSNLAIEATKQLAPLGIYVRHARSEKALPTHLFNDCLYYLDAHGCEIGGCPLKEELAILADANLSNIAIAIHDFQVPGKDFGFDTYDYPLTMSEIEPLLKRIFKNPAYHYNTEANGAYRGIVFVYEGTTTDRPPRIASLDNSIFRDKRPNE